MQKFLNVLSLMLITMSVKVVSDFIFILCCLINIKNTESSRNIRLLSL